MELEPNGTEYIIMIEEPVSILSVLSISAIITTISLFFCGIPICLEIWRRKTTEEITGFPFVMGFLGGSFWLRYGLLKLDLTMITVNAVGVSLMFLYLMFYICYTPAGKRRSILLQTGAVFALISGMLVLVQLYGTAVLDPLGFVSMTFNIINFGAPLAGMRVVLRKKCCDSLPLPLCTANLLVSSQWCLYGVLIHDIYIIVPNGVGVMLAIIQLSLFLIFPRMPGGSAPFSSCCRCGISQNDPECAVKEEAPEEPTSSTWSRHRVADRNTLPKKAAPRTSSSLLRTAVLGCATRSDSANTGITSVPPASPLTTSQALSMSEPELGVPNADDSPLPTEPILRRPFEFDRIREIDELDRQWSESELQRAQSAPEIPAENS